MTADNWVPAWVTHDDNAVTAEAPFGSNSTVHRMKNSTGWPLKPDTVDRLCWQNHAGSDNVGLWDEAALQQCAHRSCPAAALSAGLEAQTKSNRKSVAHHVHNCHGVKPGFSQQLAALCLPSQGAAMDNCYPRGS